MIDYKDLSRELWFILNRRFDCADGIRSDKGTGAVKISALMPTFPS